MIPWRSGRKGNWTLNDRVEEIYVDQYVLEQVSGTSSDGSHLRSQESPSTSLSTK